MISTARFPHHSETAGTVVRPGGIGRLGDYPHRKPTMAYFQRMTIVSSQFKFRRTSLELSICRTSPGFCPSHWVTFGERPVRRRGIPSAQTGTCRLVCRRSVSMISAREDDGAGLAGCSTMGDFPIDHRCSPGFTNDISLCPGGWSP